KVPLAPLPGAVNVTVTPLTGLFMASFTVTTSGSANAVLIVVFCGVPLVAVMDAGGPGLLVREKLAGVPTPATVAMTMYEPATLLAVKTAEVATPEALVIAVFAPPAKVPLAPLPGAANVTVTPLTALPPASLTVATNGAANAASMIAFCGV